MQLHICYSRPTLQGRMFAVKKTVRMFALKKLWNFDRAFPLFSYVQLAPPINISYKYKPSHAIHFRSSLFCIYRSDHMKCPPTPLRFLLSISTFVQP